MYQKGNNSGNSRSASVMNFDSSNSLKKQGSKRIYTILNQRWVIQRTIGILSAQNVLIAAQVNRKWNLVVDSHLRVWHRLQFSKFVIQFSKMKKNETE